MVRDILLYADPYMKISAAVDDMETYMHLDDSILNEIARSTNHELYKSRLLLRRLRKRDLYRCADQVIVPADLISLLDKASITPELIVSHQTLSDDLVPGDIIGIYYLMESSGFR